MSLALNLAPVDININVNGRSHTVRINKHGRFLIPGGYRTRSVHSATLEGVIGQVCALDADAEKKARIAKQRGAALGQSSSSAMLLDEQTGTLWYVTVRGRHASTNKILITLADGTKTSVRPYATLLRALSDEERAEVLTAHARLRTANAAMKAAAGTHVYDADVPRVSLDATYDVDSATFRTVYEGTEYTALRVDALATTVEQARVDAVYPFRVVDDQVLTAAQVGTTYGRSLFKTRDAAEASVKADAEYLQASSLEEAVLSQYLFDISVLRGTK